MKPRKIQSLAVLGALLFLGAQAQAVQQRDVKCANGRTVPATDSQTDAEACLTIGSRPAAPTSLPGNTKYSNVKMERSAADQQKATKYQRLAAQHKPRNPETEKLVKEYMRLPASQRNAFKAQHPQVQKSIWDYAPYAVCFYASVAGGADVVEAGDECHADWVE
jgi:hypothetical protein